MSTDRRYFLDVRSSANGLAWEHRLDQRQENAALAIAQGHGECRVVVYLQPEADTGGFAAREYFES